MNYGYDREEVIAISPARDLITHLFVPLLVSAVSRYSSDYIRQFDQREFPPSQSNR